MTRLGVSQSGRVRRQRFLRQGVQHGAAQAAVAQLRGQRGMVEDLAAADVHHPGMARQQVQLGAADEVAGGGRQRQGDDEDIGLGQMRAEALALRHHRDGGMRPAAVAIADDAHPLLPQRRRRSAAERAHAEDQRGLAGDGAAGARRPALLPRRRQQLRQEVVQHQHGGEGEFRRLGLMRAAGIGEPELRRELRVDQPFHPGAGIAQPAKMRGAAAELLERRLAGQQQHLRLGQRRFQRGRAGAEAEGEAIAEGGGPCPHPVLRDLPGQHGGRVHLHMQPRHWSTWMLLVRMMRP